MRPIKAIALFMTLIVLSATGFAGTPSASSGPPEIGKHLLKEQIQSNDVFVVAVTPVTHQISQAVVVKWQEPEAIPIRDVYNALFTYRMNAQPQFTGRHDGKSYKDIMKPDNDYLLRPWEYYAKAGDWRAFKIIKYISLINKPPSAVSLLI